VQGATLQNQSSLHLARFRIPYFLFFHILAHSFALFCTSEKLNLFVFMAFRTLRQKNTGVGYPL